MAEHLQRSIENHTRPRPPHDLPHTLTLIRCIAVTGTTLARRLLVLPSAMIQAVLAVVDQRTIFLGRLLLMEPVTTIEPDHKRNRTLFPIYDFSHNAVRFC